MLKKLLVAVVIVVTIFAVFVATRPASYRVSRSAAIAAPPLSIYPLVADFHQWDKWSPWAKLDPAMKTAYAGPVAAPGSSYSWSGNDKVGEGKMTIVEAKPGERLRLRLEFLKPFASTSATEFSFSPKAGGTETSWTMEGHNDFLGKAFGVFMDMDKMIGNDFEKGLKQLKAVAEAEASSPASASATR
ncbi:MAG TPA: SRPBCC family protein [Myxococcales bacterium]|nr:SRPBCC family protein [Myxococcales bacterium]